MRERHTLFGVCRELGRGHVFRTGSRLIPRRKTARVSLFLSRGMVCPVFWASRRSEPSASLVGVRTPSRWGGPVASDPQAIGYLSPFRQSPRLSPHNHCGCIRRSRVAGSRNRCAQVYFPRNWLSGCTLVGQPYRSWGGNFMVVERGEFFSELERLTEKVRRAWTYGTRNSSHSYRST